MKKFYYIISVLMLLATACQQEDVCSPEDNVPVNVVYQVQMGDDLQSSRTIGDGSQVDELIVGIFRDGSLVTTKIYTGTGDGKFNNVSIPMMTKETYNLVFWAQNSENPIYSIDEKFNVNIDYSKYTDEITLAGTEYFEAFTTRMIAVSVDNPGDKHIKLIRPFGQLNVGVTEGIDVSNVDKIEMVVKGIPTVYNPLSNLSFETRDLNLIFGRPSTENPYLEVDNTNYIYLATAFMLPVSDTNVEITIHQGNVRTKLNVDHVSLGTNERTNIVGNLLK